MEGWTWAGEVLALAGGILLATVTVSDSVTARETFILGGLAALLVGVTFLPVSKG